MCGISPTCSYVASTDFFIHLHTEGKDRRGGRHLVVQRLGVNKTKSVQTFTLCWQLSAMQKIGEHKHEGIGRVIRLKEKRLTEEGDASV